MSTLNFIFYHLFLYLSINPFIYERNQLKKIFEDLQKRVTVRNRSAVTRHTRKQKRPLQSTQSGRGKSVWLRVFENIRHFLRFLGYFLRI